MLFFIFYSGVPLLLSSPVTIFRENMLALFAAVCYSESRSFVGGEHFPLSFGDRNRDLRSSFAFPWEIARLASICILMKIWRSRFTKVKIGVQGAEECGDFWFNYRISRAAPETCAEFFGTFTADKTNAQSTKGGKLILCVTARSRLFGLHEISQILIELSQSCLVEFCKDWTLLNEMH